MQQPFASVASGLPSRISPATFGARTSAFCDVGENGEEMGLAAHTDFHATYYAHVLSQRHGHGGVERLSRSLFDACVDLNPHQIDAALFALRSPLSKGVILADEVGLGKTIEAGLLLCQLWAERKRHLLIICPAALRKQWQTELEEKFNLPAIVLDAKTVSDQRKVGESNPFGRRDAIIITSYQYASRMRAEIRQVGWHLVVIDEAHKLRNVYQSSNKMGKSIQWALEDRKKVLLTATPLQNRLEELYGLASLIDDRLFGHIKSFRQLYTGGKGDLEDLRERLKPFCHRSLRSQVVEYIRYTERRAITVPFTPTDDEQALYDAVSAFLSREQTYAIPTRQKHLTTLILRKLLASSTSAIIGTLETLAERLRALKERRSTEDQDRSLLDDLDIADEYEEEDFEQEPEFHLQSEFDLDLGDEQVQGSVEPTPALATEAVERTDIRRIQHEIEELETFIRMARNIRRDTKASALLIALTEGFAKLDEMGATRKALIFTESRRTQEFLKNLLEAQGFSGKVVLFNGTNTDANATTLYKAWLDKNADTGRASGSRAVDVKSAIVEHFRDDAEIMIATEAGAEGVNLQFCSLLINYDLPWNPQRIEQRIGRCHRYGQKHDVVVINFLNQRNEADQRVHQLLTEKFSLFSGVFGASDDVLGSLESGLDFEKRILQIYQGCRTQAEIDAAFDHLQREMDTVISARMDDTRGKILEHFDEDVHTRLKTHLDQTNAQLDRFGHMFWATTKVVLHDRAGFDDGLLAFYLDKPPPELAALPKTTYYLIAKGKENERGRYLYRPSHPLGEFVIDTAKGWRPKEAFVSFDISSRPTRIAVVEALKGQSGWLSLHRLSVQSFDEDEYLLFAALTDTGEMLDQEVCEKLFDCVGNIANPVVELPPDVRTRLARLGEIRTDEALEGIEQRNQTHFNEEREKLDKWVRDVEVAAEKTLKDTKDRIRDLEREAAKAIDLAEQLRIQERIQELERTKRRMRRDIFDIQDEADEKRKRLIDELRARMKSQTQTETLFTIRWQVV